MLKPFVAPLSILGLALLRGGSVSGSLYETLMTEEQPTQLFNDSPTHHPQMLAQEGERAMQPTPTETKPENWGNYRQYLRSTLGSSYQYHPEMGNPDEFFKDYYKDFKPETTHQKNRAATELNDQDNKEDDSSNARIYNGKKAHQDQFPYFVTLLADTNGRAPRFCNGVMLSGDVVLTLANCLYDRNGFLAFPEQSWATVTRGNVKLGQGVERQWSVMRAHPDHVYPQIENNVAIILLAGSALVPQMDIGALNDDATQPAVNSTVTVAGFGETSRQGGGMSNQLMFGEFEVLDGTGPCEIPSNETFMCINNMWTKLDLCLGDEGAPMVRESDITLWGLYVEGGRCNGKSDKAAVFLRMSAYQGWILSAACEIASVRCIQAPCQLLEDLGLDARSFSNNNGDDGGGAVSTLLNWAGRAQSAATGLWRQFIGN